MLGPRATTKVWLPVGGKYRLGLVPCERHRDRPRIITFPTQCSSSHVARRGQSWPSPVFVSATKREAVEDVEESTGPHLSNDPSSCARHDVTNQFQQLFCSGTEPATVSSRGRI